LCFNSGLKKKLTALSKEKDCVELTDWVKSVTNHLYWVAASTPRPVKLKPEEAEKHAQLMAEKWMSLSNHIHNQHVHPGHKDFTACLHGPLERKKKWIKEGKETKSFESLPLDSVCSSPTPCLIIFLLGQKCYEKTCKF
jgi:solute carrier family 8 (sodium/calcium exchanger)